MLITILTLSSFTGNANLVDFGPWVKLGSKKVNYALDRDVIHVGINDGAFKKIRLKVTKGSLNMHKVVIEYANGQKDNINVRHNFKRGSMSRVIDLEGNNRIIRDITFWYDSDNSSRRRATLTVYGKK